MTLEEQRALERLDQIMDHLKQIIEHLRAVEPELAKILASRTQRQQEQKEVPIQRVDQVMVKAMQVKIRPLDKTAGPRDYSAADEK